MRLTKHKAAQVMEKRSVQSFPGFSWWRVFASPDTDSSSEDELSLCCMRRPRKAEPLDSASEEGRALNVSL